jgi:3-hydroxybutyryl-CoA dehydrogenase
MSAATIDSVLVAGAGSIGSGVARSFVAAGVRTQVLSRDPGRLEGRLQGAEILAALPAAAPDLVVECLPEVLELKHRLYAQVEAAWRGAPVLATNTSSLPLPELAAPLAYPDRFIGMHYMYPAHERGLLVEVIRTEDTTDAVAESVVAALERCGKPSIVLNRPAVGGLFNRLQHALLREAYYLIDQGVATPQQIDDMARRFIAPRMCITGLLQQKDISGLDTHALAQRTLRPALCNEATPSPFLEARYLRGDWGLKTGRGFYDWGGADPGRVRAATAAKVARIVALMQELEDRG